MLTTSIEKEFVLECILSKIRCDGRQLFDYRKLAVIMLRERGMVGGYGRKCGGVAGRNTGAGTNQSGYSHSQSG